MMVMMCSDRQPRHDVVYRELNNMASNNRDVRGVDDGGGGGDVVIVVIL